LLEQKAVHELIARPADIPSDLKTGSARSAVVWEPFLPFAAEMPGMAVTTGGVDFEVSLFLLTRPGFAQDHASAVSAFLDGMRDACQYIQSHPQEARELVEREFGFRADFLKPTWFKVTYGLDFDPEKIKIEVDREARIAKALI
jgi:ABC-type nitrate/sulfonate/bicarbonate transport system substrate-binding protein